MIDRTLRGTDTKTLAISLIDKMISEFNIAKVKIECHKGDLNKSEIVKRLKTIESHIFNVSWRLGALPEEYLYCRGDRNAQDLDSFLETLWGSD